MSAGNPFKIVPMTDFQGKSPHGAKNLIISRKASNHRPYIFQRNIVYTPWFMARKYGAQGIACHNCIVYQTLKKLPKFQNPTESRSEILTEFIRKTQTHTHTHTHRDTHSHTQTLTHSCDVFCDPLLMDHFPFHTFIISMIPMPQPWSDKNIF